MFPTQQSQTVAEISCNFFHLSLLIAKQFNCTIIFTRSWSFDNFNDDEMTTGAGTGGQGSNEPPEIYLGVKRGILLRIK